MHLFYTRRPLNGYTEIMASDDVNVATAAPIHNGAWLYIQPKDDFISELLGKLTLTCTLDTGIAPLLYDVTVEPTFEVSVKTPFMIHDNSLLLKNVTFMPHVFLLNVSVLDKKRECVGDYASLCNTAAANYGFTSMTPHNRMDTDLNETCENLDLSIDNVLSYVVCCYGFKEFLYYGYLVPDYADIKSVEIGGRSSFKIPLYCPLLFLKNVDELEDLTDDFILTTGFYNGCLSETLFTFIFRPMCVSLRYSDVSSLIKTSMLQFVNLTHSVPKLGNGKTFRGYVSPKLTSADQDILALCDSTIAELALGYVSSYMDSAYDGGFAIDFPNWPMLKNKTREEQMKAIDDFLLHISLHVGCLVFSENSVLYTTRLWKMNNPNESSSVFTKETLLKNVFLCNALSTNHEDFFDDSKNITKIKQANKQEKYSVENLCFGTSFSPHILNCVIWHLNRVEQYRTTQGMESLYYYIINSSSGVCQYCDGKHCNSCLGSVLFRMASRFPVIHKIPKKEPCVTSLVGRQFADVTLLGGFGKKYGDRDSRDGKVTQDPLDRMKYLVNIIDYCKRTSLVDAEGSDIVTFQDKTHFVNVLSCLNKHIDEELSKFVSDMNKHSNSRDDLRSSTLSFGLELNPNMYSFYPWFAHVHIKTLLHVIQNLALIPTIEKVVTYPFTYGQYSKWVKQHYQSIYGEFKKSHNRKGFFNQVDHKIKSAVVNEVMPDFSSIKTCYMVSERSKVSYQCKLCEYQVSAVKDIRIKYRPIPKNKETPYFLKPDKGVRNPLLGPFSFLLLRHHRSLFPNIGISAVSFWQRVFNNSLKNEMVDLGDKTEVDQFMKFIFETVSDYETWNAVDSTPDTIMQYVEHRFTGKLLYICGYRGNYIGTLQSLKTSLGDNRIEQFPCYLPPGKVFHTIAEYLTYCRSDMKGSICQISKTQPYHLNQKAFENRPLLTFAYSLEKYPGASGNDEIYQCGQLGYFVGPGIDRNLTSTSRENDYRFMRRKYVIQTFLTDFICNKSKRELVLFDFDVLKSRIRGVLDDPVSQDDVELTVIYEIMKVCEIPPSLEDLLFFTDYQEHLTANIMQKFQVLDELNVTDYSMSSLISVFSPPADNVTENATAYDFSSYITQSIDTDCTETPDAEEMQLAKRIRL